MMLRRALQIGLAAYAAAEVRVRESGEWPAGVPHHVLQSHMESAGSELENEPDWDSPLRALPSENHT